MSPNEGRKLAHSALEVVVLDDVIEAICDRQLLACDSQPLSDLA